MKKRESNNVNGFGIRKESEKRKRANSINLNCLCHTGPMEVVPNLFCGNSVESLEMAQKVDVLIPLCNLDPLVWDLGFRGEILYCPIKDYGILPDDVLDNLVSTILEKMNNDIKVGLFCIGGHGRTGYVAAVVLGKLGYEDPIQFLRKRYCRKAVESDAQIKHIAKALDKPELMEKYKEQRIYDSNEDYLDELFMNEYLDGYGRNI